MVSPKDESNFWCLSLIASPAIRGEAIRRSRPEPRTNRGEGSLMKQPNLSRSFTEPALSEVEGFRMTPHLRGQIATLVPLARNDKEQGKL